MSYYSPTRINTYFRCPRLYYYRYIKRIPVEPSIHLYKGSLVHELIELVFKQPRFVSLKTFLKSELDKQWDPKSDNVILTPSENKRHKKEAELMLSNFSDAFMMKLKLTMLDNRIRDKNHAWNMLKPRLSEYELVNDDLQLKGIIDSVESGFDGRIFIIDYKTSKKFKNIVPQDYLRQVSLYALLYYRKHQQLPDYVGINYLRYGETYLFPVSDAMINEALCSLEFVKRNTQSTDIKDYPLEGDDFALKECKEIEQKLANENSLRD